MQKRFDRVWSYMNDNLSPFKNFSPLILDRNGLDSKVTDGFQFSGEKRFVNPLNVSQVTAILVIQENSCGFF